MKDRIKQVRKSLHLSQTAFGKRIGVTRDAINNVENGRAVPSELLLRSICREFNVNELWLRTGDGNMFLSSANCFINCRIKELRKLKKLSQQEFSAIIHISRSNLAGIETGAVFITDRVISDICREFGVNEIWLRTGEGETFLEFSPEKEIARFVGSNPSCLTSDHMWHLLHIMTMLDSDNIILLSNVADKLYLSQSAKEQKKD